MFRQHYNQINHKNKNIDHREPVFAVLIVTGGRGGSASAVCDWLLTAAVAVLWLAVHCSCDELWLAVYCGFSCVVIGCCWQAEAAHWLTWCRVVRVLMFCSLLTWQAVPAVAHRPSMLLFSHTLSLCVCQAPPASHSMQPMLTQVPVSHSESTHTHTRLMALCPGLPGCASTRQVKPIWILLTQETASGSGISWVTCKSAPRCRQITTPAPHHSVFYRPDALPAAQPTMSKHWRTQSTELILNWN